jgi:hypothetical protein
MTMFLLPIFADIFEAARRGTTHVYSGDDDDQRLLADALELGT